MVCAEVLPDMTLLIHDLAVGETCQFVQLVEQSQLDQPRSYLTIRDGLALIGAAASLYGVSFSFNVLLQQLGFKR